MSESTRSRVGAVLLAGGASRRFGLRNKLLIEIAGTTLLRRVAGAVSAAGVQEIVVVTGFEHEPYHGALAGENVRFVANPRWEEGIGGSVSCGVRALREDVCGALIVPGDMPGLTSGMLKTLLSAFEEHASRPVVVPVTSSGAQRNPVLWPRRYFAALLALGGEQGAKGLVAALQKDQRVDLPFDDAVFADIDTEVDLVLVEQRFEERAVRT